MSEMDEKTMFAYMSEMQILRKATARNIESLKKYSNTTEGIDILMDIEIRQNDFFGWAKKEHEVLEHAEAKCV